MKAAAHFIRIASGAVIPAVLAIGLGGYVHAAKGADISPAAETPQDGALSADVRALLAPLAAKRVEGTFEERRSVPGFPKPMLSRGYFTLEGESLVWQTQTPFASLMKVTPEGVFLEAAGEKQALTAAEIPAVGRICTLLTSVMGGRFDALSDLFAVSAAQSEGRVHISADPKSPELAQVVKHIQAEAGSYLEKLTMTGPQGDETVVLFSNVTVER